MNKFNILLKSEFLRIYKLGKTSDEWTRRLSLIRNNILGKYKISLCILPVVTVPYDNWGDYLRSEQTNIVSKHKRLSLKTNTDSFQNAILNCHAALKINYLRKGIKIERSTGKNLSKEDRKWSSLLSMWHSSLVSSRDNIGWVKMVKNSRLHIVVVEKKKLGSDSTVTIPLKTWPKRLASIINNLKTGESRREVTWEARLAATLNGLILREKIKTGELRHAKG